MKTLWKIEKIVEKKTKKDKIFRNLVHEFLLVLEPKKALITFDHKSCQNFSKESVSRIYSVF